MDTYSLFVQSLALVAVAFFVVSFHAQSRTKILILQLLGLGVWGLHFALLGAYTGALLLLVNALITIVLILRPNNGSRFDLIVLVSSLSLLALSTALTWEGFYSLFALLGVSTITVAKWQRNPDRLRVIAVIASILWIAYDLFVGSFGGIVSESVMIVSISLSLLSTKKF